MMVRVCDCRLQERGRDVADFILKRGGYVYICGDGSGMARDVTKVLVQALSDHGGLAVREAEAVLADMKTRRRFVLDIWS